MPTYRFPVNLTWTGHGSPGVNVWHFRANDAANGPQQDCVNAIHDFYTNVAGIRANGNGIFAVGMQISAGEAVDVDTQEASEYDFATITNGGGSSDIPPSSQICVSWRTTVSARRGTGRTFLGPLSASAMQGDGTPDDTVLSSLRTYATALCTASKAVNLGAIGIYGRSAPGASTKVLRDLQSARIQDQFAVLRSRRD